MKVTGKDGNEYTLKRHPLGYLSVFPVPEVDALNDYYAQKYYQNPSVATYALQYSEDELTLLMLACRVTNQLYENQFPGKNKSLYDIGCGEGFFMKGLLDMGWSVCGVDYSIAGIEKHNPEVAQYVKTGDAILDIEEKAASQQKFHLINLGNVLEHVIDPLALLKKISRLLLSDGMLRIVVPNDNSALQNILVKQKMASFEWVHPPDHLSYFNFDNLPAVLEATGYKVSQMLGDFPIELFLTNEYSNYVTDRTKGKVAHQSRVMISNLIAEKGLQNYIHWSTGLAAAGIGRTCICFAVKK